MTEALRTGELTVEGRITTASNATLYCTATDPAGGEKLACVYKPVAGERPLWDFPDGTLAAREAAAYEVSAAAGWDLVPMTVLRDGPYGPGMCQLWIDTRDDDDGGALAVLPERGGHDGWCPVLEVELTDGSTGLLAHRDDATLRRIAVFDVLINNADRKGGHLLPGADGRLYAIDHGVSFHAQDKLRTLLWGFAERELTDEERSDLTRIRSDGALTEVLAALLTPAEIQAFHARISALLAQGRLPGPGGRRRPVPWPLV